MKTTLELIIIAVLALIVHYCVLYLIGVCVLAILFTTGVCLRFLEFLGFLLTTNAKKMYKKKVISRKIFRFIYISEVYFSVFTNLYDFLLTMSYRNGTFKLAFQIFVITFIFFNYDAFIILLEATMNDIMRLIK